MLKVRVRGASYGILQHISKQATRLSFFSGLSLMRFFVFLG